MDYLNRLERELDKIEISAENLSKINDLIATVNGNSEKLEKANEIINQALQESEKLSKQLQSQAKTIFELVENNKKLEDTLREDIKIQISAISEKLDVVKTDIEESVSKNHKNLSDQVTYFKEDVDNYNARLNKFILGICAGVGAIVVLQIINLFI